MENSLKVMKKACCMKRSTSDTKPYKRELKFLYMNLAFELMKLSQQKLSEVYKVDSERFHLKERN